MKLTVCVILSIIGGSYCGYYTTDYLNHDHKDFDGTTVAKVEKWLEKVITAYKTDPNKLKKPMKFKTLFTVEDGYQVSVELNEEKPGDVHGNWEITRVDERNLKINGVLTQKNMTHNGKCFLGAAIRNEVPCEFHWKETVITVKLDFKLTPAIWINDLSTTVTVGQPEVNIHQAYYQGQKKHEIENWVSREMQKEMQKEIERVSKRTQVGGVIHKMLSDIEEGTQ